MRWVVAFFFVLVSIPVAQVAADAWKGQPGPHVWGVSSRIGNGRDHIRNGPDLAKTHHRNWPYDPFAPWFPTRAKTG